MTSKKKPSQTASNQIMNVPNGLTAARFVLAILVCVFVPMQKYEMALALFIVAATTDWMDGYWARKYGQITQFGRVFDPFVDKVIISGAFVLLAVEPGSGIPGWVAVIVVCRELLVTALRGYMEGEGIDFSAKWSGKWKMVLQCVAVVASLVALIRVRNYLEIVGGELPVHYVEGFGRINLKAFLEGNFEWLYWVLTISVWAAVILTVYSGLVYVLAAMKHLRKR